MAKRDNIAHHYEHAYYGGAYYDGNAVRKTEVPGYSPNVRIKSRPQPKKKLTKSQAAKQKKAKLRARLSMIFSILMVAAAAFAVLYRGVIITETTNRIEKKEKELTNLVASNQKLQMEIDHALDLKTVEEAATQRLGMRQPEKYQTVYVNLDQVDHVEKISSGETGQQSKLSAFFNSVKEYLD